MVKRSYSVAFSDSRPSAKKAKGVMLVRAAPSKRAPFVKGFSRSAGYYGRFTGPTPELKFFDTTLAFDVDATAEVPATGQLALIPQGVTQSERVGRKCVVKSIACHGTVKINPGAAATAANVVYIYMLQDTQCNGAAASASGDTGVFTNADLGVAHMNLANGQRFKILKKWVIALSPAAGATTALNAVIKPFSMYKKCNIPLEYDASADTGAITTIRSNNIFLVAGAQNIGGGDDIVTVSGSCRLRYSD